MTEPDNSTVRRSVERKRARGRAGCLRRMLVYLLLAGVVAAVVLAMWPKPIKVEIARVSRGPLTVSVLEEGKTRVRHRYTISAPVSGVLNRVPLRAGAPIAAGRTLLATIRPAAASFLDTRSMAQGEARVRTAEATRMLRQSEFERARTALELAVKEFARIDALLKTKSVSRQEWDTAENRVKLLTRELNSAEFSVKVAEFEVAQARAALLPASISGELTTESVQIVSPVDGYILNVQEESEKVMAAGAPIMEVGDPRDLEAEIELLSSDAVSVHPGAEVMIEQWGGDKPLRATVAVVERGGFTKFSALGVEEQRVRIRVDFIDPVPAGYVLGDRFRVEARIVTWHHDNVLQIPTGALFRAEGSWATYLAVGGKAVLRGVDIGHNSSTAAEVLGGVRESDAIIVHPPDSIRDGTAIEPESQRRSPLL